MKPIFHLGRPQPTGARVGLKLRQISCRGSGPSRARLERQMMEGSFELAMRSLKATSSVDSYASGIRCWGAFCDLMNVKHFPVKPKYLIWYLTIFNNPATAKQYLKHLQWWCRVAGHPVVCDSQMQLTLSGLSKERTKPTKRAPAILWATTRALMKQAFSRGDWQSGALYGLSSGWLFRTADEAIPLAWDDLARHSAINFGSSPKGFKIAIVDLASRKNARFGARLERRCSQPNKQCTDLMCPYHLLKGIFQRSNGRGRLFTISPTQLQRNLKSDLVAIGVPDAERYTLHGFRRGAAQEMFNRGASLSAILIAGGWRSSAFLVYLQQSKIDCDKLFECLCEEDD